MRTRDIGKDRDLALKDIRKTLAAVRDAQTVGELRRAAERLKDQAFYLRQMCDASTAMRWGQYAEMVRQEHGEMVS